MKKRILILGSTGSIGCNTLEVLSARQEEWEIVGLAAGSRWRELAEQANHFRPSVIAVGNGTPAATIQAALDYPTRIITGPDALFEMVDSTPADCVVSAVVGTAGLSATHRAVELGRRLALANKEAMVIAGSLLIPLARRSGAEIIPVDSEHSAIFQALQAGRQNEVRRVYLTASGGPFRTWSEEAMEEITVDEALQHPTWNMGPKVTIDSATMMNKAMEIIEARWLFDLRPDQIEVVIHPESIIHSMVEFCDGSVIAQMGTPDMRTPIQYALTHPQRFACPSEPLDWSRVRQLNLHPPDEERFPALRLGREAVRRGGTSGAVLNAANEAAVELFREGAIRFRDIARLTEQAMTRHEFISAPAFDELLRADRWAREEVGRCMAC